MAYFQMVGFDAARYIGGGVPRHPARRFFIFTTYLLFIKFTEVGTRLLLKTLKILRSRFCGTKSWAYQDMQTTVDV